MCNKNVTWPIKRFCLSILHTAYSAICKFVKAGGLGILKSSDREQGGGGGYKRDDSQYIVVSIYYSLYYIDFLFFVFWLTFHSIKLIITPKILILIDMKVIFGTYITHTLFCDM